MNAIEIGTVEVLRPRIYSAPDGSDIAVEPGLYPLLIEDGGIIRWRMTGRPSVRRAPEFESLGDGLFLAKPGGDAPMGAEIEHLGRSFTRTEFRDFLLTEPVVTEGHAEQRLRVRVLVEV
jgi:hypothetical protein